MVMPLMEIEYIYGGAEDMGENIHFHVELVELKGPVRHQEKMLNREWELRPSVRF